MVFPPWFLVLVLGKDGRWEGADLSLAGLSRAAGGAMALDIDRNAEAIEVYLVGTLLYHLYLRYGADGVALRGLNPYSTAQ